jgi:PAS domain S-box-containing protein
MHEPFHQLEQRYRSLLAATREVIFTLSPDGTTRSLNPAFEALTGWSVSEWLNKPVWPLIHPDDVPLAHAKFQRAAQGDAPPLFELRMRTKSGDCLITELAITPEYQHGQVTSLFGIMRDMTNSRQAEETLSQREEQLQQVQKMEAIGRLAGGIAHDFNNLLTIITGYSQLLLSRLRGDEGVRGDVEEIKNAAVRAASLTQQLLAFSRSQVLMPKVLSLNTIVDTVDAMLQRLIGEDIHLVTALDPTLGHVKADPGQMEQVIMNLAVNARDAMPRGGKLTIETGNVELTKPYHRADAALVLGRYAMLAVSDTGHGMDAETQARIFEPFFTTKGPGKGTGLGLSTVYGIIKQSGGYITVYSEPERGTTFKMYLPIVDEPIDDAEAEPPPIAKLYGNETVLLVEDEPAVRVLVRDTLRLFGYKVLEARHGFEAQLIAGQHAGQIELLITDVVMPQMSGRELAEGFAGEYAGMRVLYMSGYTESAVIHHGVLNPGTAFLQKPFTPETLARKIRDILDIGKGQKAR